MMRLLIFLLFMIVSVSAKAQENYEEAIKQGDIALDSNKYTKALNKYFAAEAFDPTKKDEVKKRIELVFKTVEDLKNKAEADEKNKIRAKAAEKKALEAKKQTDIAKNEAIAALNKANRLINAFYFYGDRFALAFKGGNFYFIDKNGDEIINLGYWTKAEQFDSRGFAKVEEFSANVLLDTFGNKYPAAYNLKDITPDIEALYIHVNEKDSLAEKILTNKSLRVLILIVDSTYTNSEFNRLITGLPQLQNLQYLSLEAFEIENFPISLLNLKRLMALNLVGNQLESLPVEIGALKNLENFNLPSNQLTFLPKEIGELSNLKVLDLSYNKLKNLPKEIGKLKTLTILDLSMNKLELLPKEIGELKNLKEINLSENNLSNLPIEIGQLKKLKLLDLSGNKFSSREIEKIKNLLPNCKIKNE